MKWKNKGHEYDRMYQHICEKKHFYLFGAGDYGRQFYSIFDREILIKGYVDNDMRKQGTMIEGIPCISLDEIEIDKETGIIITMSQIARIEPVERLNEKELKKDTDYFIIEEFLSVYYVYKYNRVYFSSISFLPSTACNLKCKYCLNFNPFTPQFYSREWKDMKADIDLFFSCVDHIMLFHVSGGEPMLYKYTVDIIEYIDKNYGDRIDTLRTVTNGTVVPTDQICERLSKCKIEVTVDDYREAVPQHKQNFDLLLQKLEKYQIKYYVNKVDAWIDLAPEKTDYSMQGEEWLIHHRSACNQSWQELRGGRLYSCNYAAYAAVAGLAGEQDAEEIYDLEAYTKDRKKELVEFRLGYTTLGYTNFCKSCRGFTEDNADKVMPAEQLER